VRLFLLLLLLASCRKHVETPLQILYAETAVENNSDAQYALYLLSEVEDTIQYYPDSIQMRYRLAQAMAQNAKGEAIDSLLPPLTEWFDANGPAKEAARAHHLVALSLLQQSRMEEARGELSLALKADPTYKASQFLTAYLSLYTGAYTEALEHFMRIEKDERSNYSVLQGAYALRSSLYTNHSDFAQAMRGEELEAARQMLTDMEFCLRYFQEHPDDDRADIIRRCAAARDSLLRSQYQQPRPLQIPLWGEIGEAQAKEELLLTGVGGSLAALALIAALWIMYRRRRKPATEQQPMPMPEPQPIFHEIVQRMEQLADGGQQPAAEEWEQLHVFVRDRYPHLVQTLEKQSLTRSETQMCLLSAVDLRQKQVATLLGISPQNLRNQRLRLLARMGGQPCESVADFTAWIEELRGTSMQ
jgi:DNA-binding CsgD family transcriptional regulator/tetratricopeptide (TPR) repeat protein